MDRYPVMCVFVTRKKILRKLFRSLQFGYQTELISLFKEHAQLENQGTFIPKSPFTSSK